MAETREWSWSKDSDDIVLPEQPETAVYVNGDGFIVVRQQSWPEDDAIVVIDPKNVPRVAEAMRAAAGIVDTPSPPKALPKPTPCRKAAAEPAGDLLGSVANG